MPDLDDLLLHPKTRAEARQFIKQPAHALMIVGMPGSGKTALAYSLSSALLSADQLVNYPYFFHLQRAEGKQDIPIDDIRDLQRRLRLKVPGRAAIRRVVFIEDAHSLSREAQNALLKSMEEPADDTVFILSTSSAEAVLPTIASRAQAMDVYPATPDQAKEFYSGHTESSINSAWQLSQGNAGLLDALLDNETEHPLKQAVEQAKDLLRKSPYERLLELDKISKDKEQLALLLVALGRVIAALHHVSIGRGTQAKSILAGRQLIQKLQKALAANTSPRLIVIELALNLNI